MSRDAVLEALLQGTEMVSRCAQCDEEWVGPAYTAVNDAYHPGVYCGDCAVTLWGCGVSVRERGEKA